MEACTTTSKKPGTCEGFGSDTCTVTSEFITNRWRT